ncbi:hypothetical protein, unlikely [Trypanosoma brucei gambiense DAL972]|uniref:Uncharacterized protein n=1 Tax=Trypanosoma brucei gambiense (strain MHOM/CI/86/DAL972) TaxID=679716 RepID=C9ZTV2_TRYB9|nr:hypothetical protein, unlikely [Trypanosoma brucei gambiense DAL972]CBH12838.1 hypothetical protein, unlikely [Trypanosoma brucei gambiense DAL972]|eukprot:XP_011775117.1 hypothetical protein, unlikely [Trypanosoma brucei gambiense DAL972]
MCFYVSFPPLHTCVYRSICACVHLFCPSTAAVITSLLCLSNLCFLLLLLSYQKDHVSYIYIYNSEKGTDKEGPHNPLQGVLAPTTPLRRRKTPQGGGAT